MGNMELLKRWIKQAIEEGKRIPFGGMAASPPSRPKARMTYLLSSDDAGAKPTPRKSKSKRRVAS